MDADVLKKHRIRRVLLYVRSLTECDLFVTGELEILDSNTLEVIAIVRDEKMLWVKKPTRLNKAKTSPVVASPSLSPLAEALAVQSQIRFFQSTEATTAQSPEATQPTEATPAKSQESTQPTEATAAQSPEATQPTEATAAQSPKAMKLTKTNSPKSQKASKPKAKTAVLGERRKPKRVSRTHSRVNPLKALDVSVVPTLS